MAGSLATVSLRLLAIMVTGFVVVTGTALWLGPWGASAVAPDLDPPKLQSSAQELVPVTHLGRKTVGQGMLDSLSDTGTDLLLLYLCR